MDGDLVAFEPARGGRGDRARVIKVIKRGRSEVSGVFVPT